MRFGSVTNFLRMFLQWEFFLVINIQNPLLNTVFDSTQKKRSVGRIKWQAKDNCLLHVIRWFQNGCLLCLMCDIYFLNPRGFCVLFFSITISISLVLAELGCSDKMESSRQYFRQKWPNHCWYVRTFMVSLP